LSAGTYAPTRPRTLAPVTDRADAYLAREARARIDIDGQLAAAGWIVQGAAQANVGAALGVAVREFALEKGHGRVDYLLFLNGQPAGVIEAKPEGTTLVEVEHQSGRYVDGLPGWIQPPVYPLPFIYESTGSETRFTNGYDPDARSRRVFTFHRPETLAEWSRQILADPTAPTFRARLTAWVHRTGAPSHGRTEPRRSSSVRLVGDPRVATPCSCPTPLRAIAPPRTISSLGSRLTPYTQWHQTGVCRF
jgi:Type I restriction enzyme R protein N terminus (HSDR_N)